MGAQQLMRRAGVMEGRAGIVAHRATLVRADDHMRATVIACHHRLQQRLARAGQPHR